MTSLSRDNYSSKTLWWMTASCESIDRSCSKTRLLACTLDTPGAMFRSAKTGLSDLSEAMSSSVSVPSIETIYLLVVVGRARPPLFVALAACFRGMSATASG